MQLKLLLTLTACLPILLSFFTVSVGPAKSYHSPPQIPAGIEVVKDLAYVSAGHERQKLDLYRPKTLQKSLPVIVWVHGGGWSGGDKNPPPDELYSFVQTGFAVASINYRLSGDVPFPAQIEDCMAAVRWLRANADKYGLDSRHIGIWGHSAGGHLVSLMGTSGDTDEFSSRENSQYSSRVQAVVDYCGPTDLTKYSDLDDVASRIAAQLFGSTVRTVQLEKARVANPLNYVSKNDPPFLIVHGDQDKAVPLIHSEILLEALRKAGVRARLHIVRNAGHSAGFGDPVATQMVRAFFQEHLMSSKRLTSKKRRIS